MTSSHHFYCAQQYIMQALDGSLIRNQKFHENSGNSSFHLALKFKNKLYTPLHHKT